MKLEPYTNLDRLITRSKRFIAEYQSMLRDSRVDNKYNDRIERYLKDEQDNLRYVKDLKALNKDE